MPSPRVAATRIRGPKPPFRVQLMIDPTLTYFREATLGVRQYGFETGRLEIIDRWLEHERLDLPALVARDGVQGIVAAVHRPAPESKLAGLGIPVINVSNTMPLSRLTVVTQDDHAVGRMAAEHLCEAGCRQFAFWGQNHALYSMERLTGFREGIAKVGGKVEVLHMLPLYGRREYNRILHWLEHCAPPLGVFAVLDDFALLVLRAARELGLRVPDDVAVLGAGDDDFLVGFERVPLSSVTLPARKIGYEAGAEIDRQISSSFSNKPVIRLDPIGVNARQSTDTIFARDEVVVKALRYIRSHAAGSPYISDIARFVGVARTTLQTRFHAVVGHTMLDEIQRVRIQLAKELLRTSDLSLEMISDRCGFGNSQRFSVLFRQRTGMAPSQFRRASR
jgi:LacI family transcriptional regulator